MRNWRELWQNVPPPVEQRRANREQLHAPRPRQQKQASFHWLANLLNRDLPE